MGVNRPDLEPLENCSLLFVDEVFAVEEPGTQLTALDLEQNPSMSPVKRMCHSIHTALMA